MGIRKGIISKGTISQDLGIAQILETEDFKLLRLSLISLVRI